jgi:hypothetical protein
MMWSSQQRPKASRSNNSSNKNRSANIRRYLGRDSILGRDSFASLNDDESDDGGGSLEVEHGARDISTLTIAEDSVLPIEDEFGCSSTWQENSPVKGPQQQQQQDQESSSSSSPEEQERLIELDTTELLDMEHYLLSVYDKSDDSSSIYTGGTASTSFSSSSTTSTRTRHRGAYKQRRRHVSKKSTTAPMSWLESMEHRAYGNNNGLEWTPQKGWHRKKEADAWDAAPTGDWSAPNAVFDSIDKQRIEI